MWRLLAPLASARDRVVADLRADPVLVYVLAGTLLLSLVGVWHRVPNVATYDERDRLLDPLVAYGAVLSDPSVESLRAGVAWGRQPFGATFYLYALALAPVLAVAALAGDLGAVATLGFPAESFGYYGAWTHLPAWLWTAGLLAVRLTNVVLAVVCVYLTYRLGVALRGRPTGRLAAALFGLTFGLVSLAHEGGEDIPMLAALLLTLLLLVSYVRSGRTRTFLAASATGGLALAFKLTAAPVVPVVGLAHLLRARTGRARLYEPRLVAAGATTGGVVALGGFPTALVGRVDLVGWRLVGQPVTRVVTAIGPDAPAWWWFLRGYLQAFGLPLALVALAGAAAALVRLCRSPRTAPNADLLVVATLGLYLAVLWLWHDVRVHHLLPTLPLVVVLAAGTLDRARDRRPRLARPLLAVLLVTTAAYAGVGAGQYVDQPRDRAAEWADAHGEHPVETYRWAVDETGLPHGADAYTLAGREGSGPVGRCPAAIQLSYQDFAYLRDVPTEHRSGYFRNVESRAAYLRWLLESDDYAVVAAFGLPAGADPTDGDLDPDRVAPQRPTPGSLLDLLPVGLAPHTDQYGDEQDLALNQQVVFLERTGPCNASRAPPW